MFNRLEAGSESSSKPVLYLGDSSLNGAAGYLAGVMSHYGVLFDYVDSSTPPEEALLAVPRRLIIISDYVSKLMGSDFQQAVVNQVHSGTGLLMIGGWESFCGLGGNWADTPVGEILPVQIGTSDDRINYDQLALVKKVADHPVLEALPWKENPPAVGGFNRFKVKAGSNLLLEVTRYRLEHSIDELRWEAGPTDPMLVVGEHGKGRTAALATDLAPHWVGPMVDWGTENQPAPSGGGRVCAQAPGGDEVEVGCHYARFVYQLLAWTGQLEAHR